MIQEKDTNARIQVVKS